MSDLLAQRYHTGRPVVRLLVGAVVGLVCLAAAVWVAWAFWGQTHPDVSSGLASYRILDAHRVSATVDLRLRQPGIDGRCVLQALASDHQVVGELDFRIPHDGSTSPTTTLTMRTVRRAFAVNLLGCTTPNQPHPG